MSKMDLDLEKARKEKEDLAKDLEKVENKAQAIETTREIQFIKSNSTLASWPKFSTQTTNSMPTCGLVISSQDMSPSTPISSSTTII